MTDYYDERNILSEMIKYDHLIQKFYDTLRKYQSEAASVIGFAENIDDQIKQEFADIGEEMNQRLRGICKLIYGNKENVLNETLKYKQEIIQLTQENIQIADEIMSLKEKIKHMEEIIGRDHPERLMNYTK